MAKAKYKQYYERMVEQNQELFNEFKELHDRYDNDQEGLQKEFNEKGEEIMELVREWENKLCMQSEKGGFSNFTSKLAEKFRDELRKDFTFIDHVGLIVSGSTSKNGQAKFEVKKIKLF